MKYFRIKQDSRDINKLLINKLHTIPNMNKILTGNLEFFPQTISLPVGSSEYNRYPDMLSEQLFLVKENLFDLIRIFDDRFHYSSVFLTDSKNKQIHFYYLPHIPMIDCISEKSEANLDKSSFKKIVIKNKSNYPDIFRIGNVKDKIIVVSLNLAEAILRRNLEGIMFEKVYIEEV